MFLEFQPRRKLTSNEAFHIFLSAAAGVFVITLCLPIDPRLIHVKACRHYLLNKTPMSEKPLLNQSQAQILSLDTETQFAANGIVSRTLMRTPTTRVVLFGFAAGQELSEHTSTAQALIQVLSGSCEFSLEGHPHQLKTGNLLYMPPNLPHAVKATERFSMLLTLLKPSEAASSLSGVKAAISVAS